MLNLKLSKAKELYEERIRAHLKYQEKLLKKIYLFNKFSPHAYSLINLSVEEIFQALPEVEFEPEVIWQCLNKAYGPDFFLH